MFDPLRNPDRPGDSPRSDGQALSPTLRNALELRPTALKVENLTLHHFLALLDAFELSLPLDLRNRIYESIAHGDASLLGSIADSLSSKYGASFEYCRLWQITSSSVRPTIECTISFDEARQDLHFLSFVLRSAPGCGQVSLSALFDESSLHYQGLRPDRWFIFERIMSAIDLPAPPPGIMLSEQTATLPLSSLASLEFRGLEEVTAPALNDPHLPLRPELAADVLHAEQDVPVIMQANRLVSRICNGRPHSCIILDAKGNLEEAWSQFRSGRRRNNITVIKIDGLLLPISRTATLQTLQHDVEVLKQLRSEIQLREPDASLVAPVAVVAEGPTPKEAQKIFEIIGISLSTTFLEHLYDVCCEGVSFDPATIHPKAFSPQGIEFRLGYSSAISSFEDGRDTPFFRFRQPGSPAVQLWASQPGSDDEYHRSTTASSRELLVFATWEVESPQVSTAKSIARWEVVKQISHALGQPSLPEHAAHFFTAAPEESDSNAERLLVLTIKKPPLERKSS